jgi:hypothetical protein
MDFIVDSYAPSSHISIQVDSGKLDFHVMKIANFDAIPGISHLILIYI